jgi:hypothetical protein
MFDNADAYSIENRNNDDDKKKRSYDAVSFNLIEHLHRIIGFDLTTVPGIDGLILLTLVSEVGIDMSKWPTERHFSSWFGLSPNHKISGGKILGRRSRKVINRAASALRLAAQSAGKTTTALGAFYRRLKGRVGPSKATTATARKLACIYYRCLKNGSEYVELGLEYYEKKYKNRMINNLRKNAEKLGMKIIPIDNQMEGAAICQPS